MSWAAGPLLFALESTRELGEQVAQALGQAPAPHEERDFEDGEHISRPLTTVRDRDVYVVQSLHGRGPQSVDDKLVRLLFFLAVLRQDGAGRVTAVLPYLAYSRKDRRTRPHDPVSSRYLAMALESMGVDRVLTLEVHNPAAYQNAFRCPSEHLALRLLLESPLAAAVGAQELVVVSPDVGGIKRAEDFRAGLAARLGRPVGNGFMEKRRSAGRVSGERLVGEVAGRTVLMVDDLVASGTTLARAADACREAGATRILAAVAHGVFAPGAGQTLAGTALERLFVSDSIPARFVPEPLRNRVEVVGCAGLLAEAIRSLHQGQALPGEGEPV